MRKLLKALLAPPQGPDQTAIAEDFHPAFDLPPELRQPTVDEVRAGWQRLYDEQSELLGTVIEKLQEANETVILARHLIAVMAMRSADGPVFLLNEAEPGAADILRHAIISLQSKLEGSEIPDLCLDGSVQ